MTDGRQKGVRALLRVERVRDARAAVDLAGAVAKEAQARDACAAAQTTCHQALQALAACLAPAAEGALDLARYEWLAGHHRVVVAHLEQAAADHEEARRTRQTRADARVQTQRRCERLAEQLDRLDEAATAVATAQEREEGTETWLAHRKESR